ncbi:MAG: DNA recombination protein RmuC [Candidatus Paceibacterota bacterium]|jgi:DNA recombination protein RmuC
MADLVLILIIALVALTSPIAVFFLVKFLSKNKIDQKQNEALLSLERRMGDLMNELKGTVDGKLTEIRSGFDKSSNAMNSQMVSVVKETTQLKQGVEELSNIAKEISTFQEFFKAPKLRGQWGEATLEHILGQYFPKELYQRQYLFSSGEQVDAILKLPDGKLLPIDAKFNFDNFRKMVETEKSEEKAIFKKKFLEDTKIEIQRISSKYILPSENTIDFALMYIPAEAVYYELNTAKDTDLINFAWSKKVILASPNTIYLTLKVIEHWFKDTQVSQQTQEILKRLSKIQQDSEKLMEDFRKLGSHLKNASSAYENSERRLSMFDDKVERLLTISEEDNIKKLN